MKLVAISAPEMSDWLTVDAVMNCLSRTDTIIHSGSFALGGKIERVAKRTSRGNRPVVERQFPETPKYETTEAYRRNAIQLLAHHRPDVVLLFGDAIEGEVQPVLDLAETMHIKVVEAREFVRARRQQN